MKCSIHTAPGVREEQRQQPLATIVLTIVAFIYGVGRQVGGRRTDGLTSLSVALAAAASGDRDRSSFIFYCVDVAPLLKKATTCQERGEATTKTMAVVGTGLAGRTDGSLAPVFALDSLQARNSSRRPIPLLGGIFLGWWQGRVDDIGGTSQAQF